MALGGREDQAEEPQGRESVSRGQSVPSERILQRKPSHPYGNAD